eukprot:CAMPEP_0114347346 /NCGR_PEP_ID=MMETSP0101-20121206/13820_1 /TAXON_ID=38822 ORGANISM="Pteridomonas danica, Strain PT" /NCGR_SAMPLE_ID=MMETSP0101 /ASSEMBLY_ACC=CAM_ASM_000211 /LENGTH=81 /DNA_ID=CAMNT_0001484587 /DNA_START=578 /DNA_END=823 /DNA_ORIENTATION=-
MTNKKGDSKINLITKSNRSFILSIDEVDDVEDVVDDDEDEDEDIEIGIFVVEIVVDAFVDAVVVALFEKDGGVDCDEFIKF